MLAAPATPVPSAAAAPAAGSKSATIFNVAPPNYKVGAMYDNEPPSIESPMSIPLVACLPPSFVSS